METTDEKERLRHVALAVLAARHPRALGSRQVLNRAAMEVDFRVEAAAVESALHFLMDLGHVARVLDDFGRTERWQATAQGLLAVERQT